MYKYLLWDIDGTVLNFLAAEAYAIRFLFKKYDLGVCDDEKLKLYSGINKKYWGMLERNELTKPEILIGRFREFFGIIGADTSIAESFNKDYQVTLGDFVIFIDHAKEVLLSQKGKYVLAAVTNGTKIAQEKKLKASGLDKIFDAVFISENIGFEKPNKEFFEAIGADPSIAESFNKDYQSALGDYIEFISGAKDVLLSQKGKYTLAAVTNGTKIAQEKKLKASGLDKIFDAVFISENVGFEKPNKEFFDYVFASLGITDRSEALIIGDSLTSDILGGVNSGIDTCWFNPSHKPNSLSLPVTYEIDDIGKLNDIV